MPEGNGFVPGQAVSILLGVQLGFRRIEEFGQNLEFCGVIAQSIRAREGWPFAQHHILFKPCQRIDELDVGLDVGKGIRIHHPVAPHDLADAVLQFRDEHIGSGRVQVTKPQNVAAQPLSVGREEFDCAGGVEVGREFDGMLALQRGGAVFRGDYVRLGFTPCAFRRIVHARGKFRVTIGGRGGLSRVIGRSGKSLNHPVIGSAFEDGDVRGAFLRPNPQSDTGWTERQGANAPQAQPLRRRNFQNHPLQEVEFANLRNV